MYNAIVDAGKFRGIDNLTDPLAIPPGGPKGTYLVVGVNVDIDDEYRLLRRPGYSRVDTGNFHSLWSNGTVGYVVKRTDGTLYAVDDEGALTSVASVDPVATMQYVYQNGRTYCTNNSIIGYIESNTLTLLPAPDDFYKQTMPAGHLLEFHRGRLIVARDTILYISDAYMPHYYDVRLGWRNIGTKVTMLKSVDSGVFLGTEEGAFFAEGQNFLESSLRKITDSPPILGSAVAIAGDEIYGKGIGDTVCWASDEGIWRGTADGSVVNVTWDHYTPDESPVSSAVAHALSGFTQYCVIHAIELEVEDANIKMNLTVPQVVSIGA